MPNQNGRLNQQRLQSEGATVSISSTPNPASISVTPRSQPAPPVIGNGRPLPTFQKKLPMQPMAQIQPLPRKPGL